MPRPVVHGLYVGGNHTVRKGTYDGKSETSTFPLRIRETKIKHLFAKAKSRLPWLEPADMSVLKAWCELEIVAVSMFNRLMDNGIFSAKGEPRNDLLNHLRTYRKAQLSLANALGMTPAGRMAIRANGTHAALDLAGACAVEDGAEPQPSEPAGVIDDKS